MGTLTEFYRDEFSEYPRNVPIEETYRTTADTLEKAKEYLDKCSRGILALHSIPGSSRPEFDEARFELTGLAQIYTSVHFPMAVLVVRDVRDVFTLYAGFDIKKLKNKTLKAMEKTITEHATNSADSSRVHGLLITDLERFRIKLGKKSQTLKNDAGKMRETFGKLRQEIMKKNLRYTSEHDDCIARKERYREEKVKHDAETAEAAASVLEHSNDVIVREKEAKEARDKKDNAVRQGTYGTVAGAVGAGAVTMTGGYCAVVGAVGATAMTGGLLLGGAAILGVGAMLMTTAKEEERSAEGAERVATSEGYRARDSRERATEERGRATRLAEEANQKMRRAAQDAAQVAERKAGDLYRLVNEAKDARQGADECDVTVQLLSSVLDPLQQFVEAMETVSQFLSGLASDIDSCLGQVTAGRDSGRQRMNRHFTLMQSYIGRVISRCDNFENFRDVVQARIDALDLPSPLRAPDALASSASWIQDHLDRGLLSVPASQRIRGRLRIKSPSQWYHIPAIGCFRSHNP